jgi:hypothetical protein
MVAQEIEKPLSLAPFGAEMDVRQEECAKVPRPSFHRHEILLARASHMWACFADFCFVWMTGETMRLSLR